jgi:two-component system, OmpR family, sensor histidine kinase KdpD
VWEVDDLLAQAVSEVAAADRVRITDVDGLPPVAVDAAQIQRVLVNVLDNALKYSVADVVVRARTHGASVLVEVLDEGGATVEPGLGLGLTIARGFAEANGATLELTRREDGGTRALLALPLQPLPARVAS